MVVDFTNPWLQLFILPLALGLAGHGLIIFFHGRDRGNLRASNAVGYSFLLTALLVTGLPVLPPTAFVDILILVTLSAIVMGWLLDRPASQDLLPIILACLSMGLVLWAFLPEIQARGISDILPRLLVAGALSCLCFFRLQQESDYALNTPLGFCACAAGVAGLALMAPSPLLYKLAVISASATLSYMMLYQMGLKVPLNLGPVLVMASSLVIIALGVESLRSDFAGPLCLLALPLLATPLSSWQRINFNRPQTSYVFWLAAPPAIAVGWAALL